MNFNHDAIICLRSPVKSGLPSPPEYEEPTVRFLTDSRWCTVLRSLPPSTSDGNPPPPRKGWRASLTSLPFLRSKQISSPSPPPDWPFQLRIDPAAKLYTSTETWIDPNDKPDPLEVEARPRTRVATGKVLDTKGEEDPSQAAADTAEEKRVSQFQQDGPKGRKWEVIAWGKQGQLESWMKEDPVMGYIVDDSGDGRPDWRNHYVVVYYEATAEQEAAVEVWDSNAKWRRLTDETLEKIKSAIRGSTDRELAKLADKMVEVKQS